MLSLELKQKLIALDSEIAKELACENIDGNIDKNYICDNLYLGAEFMPQEGMIALYNICYNLALRRFDKEYNCDFEKEFKVFENSLKELYNKAENWKLHYTDDGWHYSLSSLDLPHKLAEFCRELDRIFWNDESEDGYYGKNHCLDVLKMIYESEVCNDCMIWERIYQINFDTVTVNYELQCYNK